MRRLSAGVMLALSAALVAFSAVPAQAATHHRTSASLPKTVLKIRSIEWHHRTGTVAVSARVKCTGRGTFSWQASLEQHHARDKGSAKVPCDGDGFRSTIELKAHQGRFHPGPATFGHGSVTTGGDVGIGFFVVRQIRISPR
jgi:hypothetical protein